MSKNSKKYKLDTKPDEFDDTVALKTLESSSVLNSLSVVVGVVIGVVVPDDRLSTSISSSTVFSS